MSEEEKLKPVKAIDIVNNVDQVYSKTQIASAWIEITSSQPPSAWVKNNNPQAPDNQFMKDGKGNLIPYMQIQTIEMLMDKFLMFPKLKITNSGIGQIHTDKGQKSLAYMNVELEYFNHGLDAWSYTSGSASMEIKGNFQWNLVFPKLKAEAFKNAAKSIGNLFGRRIGQADTVMTESTISIKKKDLIINELKAGAK